MPSPAAPSTVSALVARFLVATLVAAAGSIVLAQGQQQPPPQPPPAGQGQQAPAGQQPPAGQGQQAPQEQRPVFRVEANFVRVDVYPTANGKPVTDLNADEFEILEDNVPQQIRTFEHVVVKAPTAEDLAARPEPNTVSQSREMVAESNARLFVLFLDTYHISREGAMNVRAALIRFLSRTLGPDDLVAVVTPEMSVTDVTFARRTSTIEELVDKYYRWSRRDTNTDFDPIEERYMECYPPGAGDSGIMSAVAREMIRRRRERLTLEALQGLVVHLGGLREERKAVLAVSEGWLLYQPSNGLMSASTTQGYGLSQVRCDGDRAALAQEDHLREFQKLLDDANRANVSFYPLDPRGLVVFDSPISAPLTDLLLDSTSLSTRLNSLQTMASATDGVAIVNSNDIDRGLRRVLNDLTSYYLIGYYSTNAKQDGRFRTIKVRVKRSGVDVRARRGYRAPTKEEIESKTAAVAAATAPPSPTASALSGLGKIRADAVVQAQGGYVWTAADDGTYRPTLWLVGEWDPSRATRDEQWKGGAEVSIAIAAPDKASLEASKQVLTREARTFSVRVPVPAGQTAGDYTVRLTTKPVGAVLGSTDTLHVIVPKWPAPGSLVVGEPQLFRRGPYTGPNWLPAGDVRFRRQERVRLEVTVPGQGTSSAVRLLDRAGKPLNLPIAAGERDEAGGKVYWGELTLAPLSNGDYVLETTVTRGSTTQQVLSAFRIIP